MIEFENKQSGTSNKDDSNEVKAHLMKAKAFYRRDQSFKPMVHLKVDGFNVIDESQGCPVGWKARAAAYFFSGIEEDEIVYVQPRQGFAGISLAYLCKIYGKKLTLVMPSSKAASHHQRLCIELGAKPKFTRIAAMPNANSLAKKYAEATGARFIPLGLDHPQVIAGSVACIENFFEDKEKPKSIWSVFSTGVLSRSIQLALPDSKVTAVAVSRNVQPGELGRAEFMSYHKPFLSPSETQAPFDSEPCYDAKGWDYFKLMAEEDAWFFNVAGEALPTFLKPEEVDSYRDWRDLKDFPEIL